MSGTNIYGELIRAQLQQSSSALSPTANGLVYYDTSLNTARIYTAEGWKNLGSSSSGAGEINAVLNPSVAEATTGWANGTSHTLTRVISGSPLDPVVSTALSIAASSTASESSTSGEYYTISTMPTGLRNKKLKVEFYFTTEASQTWAVSVWQSSTRKALSTDSSGATLLPANTTGKFVAYFDTDSSTSYTVNLTRTAGSGTATLLVTNVIVGPGIQPQGSIVSSWESWTPTFYNLGTTSNVTFLRRRVGNMLEVRGYFTTGTVPADIASIGLPSGLTIDLTGIGNRSARLGSMSRLTSSTIEPVILNVLTYSSTGGTDRLLISESTASGAFEQKNIDGILASSENQDVYMLVPIAEWAGSGTVNLAQNDIEYAYNTDTSDATNTTAFGYGPKGSKFGSFTAVRQKTVRFQTPHQEGDSYTLEVWDTTSWAHLGSYSNSIIPLTNQGIESYGMSLNNSSSSTTDLLVEFGKYRLMGSGTFGAAGLAWADVAGTDTYKWRVKKVKGGVAAGFGLADAVNGVSGLTTLPYSMIRLNTGNGFGSTNTKIRRFSTVVQSVGSDITYADSSTLGATLTINRAGVYSIQYTDRCSAVATIIGISKNSTQLTTNIETITAADRLAVQNSFTTNAMSGVSVTVILSAGDVIRPHAQGAASSSTAVDETLFTITQVARF